jgi:signal transduction histidine kinase
MQAFDPKPKVTDFNKVLRTEIPKWCEPGGSLVPDFSGLTSDDTSIYVDRRRLAAVIQTLIMNAVGAMSRLTDKKLIVSSVVRSQRVEVNITNTGEISEKIQLQLFKGPIPKVGGEEGMGIGLLIARSIMRLYGGDVELLQTGPEGTTFSLWLPLHSSSSTQSNY